MIKPYYKHEHSASIVEVEDFGLVNLNELPIAIKNERKGNYEINWVTTHKDGQLVHLLSEHGGVSSFDFGGRELGVLRELN